MKLFASWVLNAVSFLFVASVIPGILVRDFWTALWISFLWGILGVTLRPLLLILTLPVNLLTLGLFTFVVNALLLWLLAFWTDGFSIASFGSAFLGALLFSLVSFVLGMAFRKKMNREE